MKDSASQPAGNLTEPTELGERAFLSSVFTTLSKRLRVCPAGSHPEGHNVKMSL